MMFTVITRTKFFAGLVILFLLGSNLLAAQENNNDALRQLTELEGFYAEEKIKLKEQSLELDRILGLGYGGTGLGKDMKNIAKKVESVQARINDLKQQLGELVKSMNINPIRAFKIIPHRGTKDAPPMLTSAQEGDKVYFTADVPHPSFGEAMETRLAWSMILPDGSISDKLKKTDVSMRQGKSLTYSFGINTSGMELGEYQVILEHSVTGNPKQKYQAKVSFELNSERNAVKELKIIRLVVDDERSGDKHQAVLPAGASLYLFSYYEVPADVTMLAASYRVYDLTSKKTIYKKTGRRNTKPDMEVQRVGIRLDPNTPPLTVGHEYRFDISFTDNLRSDSSDKEYKKVKDSITFFYGSEPKRLKLGRKIATNIVGDGKYLYIIPKAQNIQVGHWYTATSPVGEMNVTIRLINSADKTLLAEKTFIHMNNKDTEREQFTALFNTDLLKKNARYRIETVINVEGIAPIKKGHSFKYAKIKQPRLGKLVRISGNIQTPGSGSTAVTAKRNAIKLNSTITFKATPIYPEGLTGQLIWEVSNSNHRKIIKLDGSNNDWSFSFRPTDLGGNKSYQVSLIHRPGRRQRERRVFSAGFNVSVPFHVTTLGHDGAIYEKDAKTGERERQPSWKGYAWLKNEVGIKVTANDFPVRAKVSVKAILKETGEILFSETKSISLAAEETKKMEWKLNQSALKFVFNDIFPNIDYKRDVKKTIITEFTIDNGKDYKVEKKATTTQWIFVLNNGAFNGKHFKAGPRIPKDPLVETIIPPADMKGPFKASITGISAFYMDGLKWYYDPDKLKAWVNEAGAEKYKETKDKISYRKAVPLLITLEDSTGKQAVAFWEAFNYSANIWKEKPAEEQEEE